MPDFNRSEAAEALAPAAHTKPTACIAMADGTVIYGIGFGAEGISVAEL